MSPIAKQTRSEGRVWIKAIRNIAANEELTYDYNLYDGDESDAECNCGSVRCRRTMYSHDEIRRRRRAAKAANRHKSRKEEDPLPRQRMLVKQEKRFSQRARQKGIRRETP